MLKYFMADKINISKTSIYNPSLYNTFHIGHLVPTGHACTGCLPVMLVQGRASLFWGW